MTDDKPTKDELGEVIDGDERPMNEVVAETMAEAFDKAQEESDNETEMKEGEEAKKEEETKASEETKDETKEAPPGEKPEERAASEETPKGEPEDQPGTEGADEDLSPPERWSQEDKETFGALPREAQEIVLKRERDVERHLTQKSQELSEEKRGHAELDQLIETRRQAWALQGMTPSGAIGQIVQLAEIAEADPAKFITWFAGQRGVDLSALAEPDSQDPAIAALNKRQDGLEQQIRSSAQQQDLSAQQAAEAVIADFRTKPENKHFDAVENDLLTILPQVKQANPAGDMGTWLKESYDRAVWANPTVRNQILQDQKKAEEQERLKAQKAEAEKARKAAGANISPKGAPEGGGKAKGSIKDTMAAKFDELNAA
ncbi:MAG: hypothetical protein ACR2QF_04190 [Geminicoccaceae bacterium]